MQIDVFAQHNQNGYILFSERFPGAYGRAETRLRAMEKLLGDVVRYAAWEGWPLSEEEHLPVRVVEDTETACAVEQGQTDLIWPAECAPMQQAAFDRMHSAALRTAADFMRLFDSVRCKDQIGKPPAPCFYGTQPVTARQMLRHTAEVTEQMFARFDISAPAGADLPAQRAAALAALGQRENLLENIPFQDESGEQWTVQKLLRRLIWHDRIHSKAMWRMARGMGETPEDPFLFGF